MEKVIPEPIATTEQKTEDFLEFRKANANQINEEICVPYYEQDASLENLTTSYNFSDEELKIVEFILESFKKPKSPDKLKRKSGQYIAVHSLQLFMTAKDFYKINNPDIFYTLLLHDVAEDTEVSLDDIKKQLGEKFSKLASSLTEERGETEKETPYSRKKGVVEFADQIVNAGLVAVTAEILDRIDDISDLDYIFSKLRKNPDDETEKASAKKKLLDKFAKCSYTVSTLSKIKSEDKSLIEKFVNDFRNLLEIQVNKAETEYGIQISKEEIANLLKQYSEIEEQIKERQD